jgi:signal transduction histidine kinase
VAETAQKIIDRGTASFSSDSQILSELGERLIASNKIALSELIKNAYDADATRCHIWLEEENGDLIIKDDGHGMTREEFLEFWMTIATPNRTRDPKSKRFGREVTGSKGVGRFAVRNLGRSLELSTVAYYSEQDEYRRLTAEFDWEAFEMGEGLQEGDIEYVIEPATEEEEGTELRISKLQEEWSQEKLEGVSEEVLDIISAPYDPTPSEIEADDGDDPGFSLFFARPGEGSPKTSAAHEIYERYAARVEITVSGEQVAFDYEYTYGYDDPRHRSYSFDIQENFVGDLSGEIRYLPRRKGMFKGMQTVDGRNVNKWLQENGGVRVIDNNFRIPPYGERGNDWLDLSETEARRERDWRSSFTTRHLPDRDLTPDEIRDRQLNIPRKNQVLGAVQVSSRPEEGADPEEEVHQLMSAMDRQGLVENQAFDQLKDIVRGSLEILAIVDVDERTKQKEEEAEEKKDDVKDKIESAKRDVKERVDLSPTAKQDIIETYDELEEEVEEYQEAEEEARTAVESMHLLGVITGFMSHETDNMLQSAERMLSKWREVPEEERSEEFQERIKVTESAVEDLKNHLGYAKRFMGALEDGSESSFKVRPRVVEIVEQLETYTEPRHIDVENNIPHNLKSPEMNISLYSGILLNLYSNAVKAVLPVSRGKRDRKVQFQAENTDEWHIIRVSDTGVGVPDGLEDRIFDPLFSTTDVDADSPLGGGTGMGLYVIRRVLNSIGGEISVVEPPEGYETCFEVKIQRD